MHWLDRGIPLFELVGILSVAPFALASQAPGIPSYHRFTTRGVGFAVDYGFAGPNILTDFKTWRVTTTFGFGPRLDSLPTAPRLFNVGASVSRFTPRAGTSTTVWGFQGGVFLDIVRVGFARWDSAGATRWRAPLGVGLPILGCYLRPVAVLAWGGARLDVDHVSRPGSGGRTIARPGYVLGIHLELRNGLGLQVAADQPRLLGKKSWIFGAGVHYAFHSLPTVDALVDPAAPCFWPLSPPS